MSSTDATSTEIDYKTHTQVNLNINVLLYYLKDK